MKRENEFFELAKISPFTALIHVHDHCWLEKEFSLEERMAACEKLRELLMEITIRDAAKRGTEKKKL